MSSFEKVSAVSQVKSMQWQQRYEDAFQLSKYIFRGLLAVWAFSFIAMMVPGISPVQVKYANFMYVQSGTLILFGIISFSALYLLKGVDFYDMFSAPPSEWLKKASEKRPWLVTLPSTLASFILFLLLFGACLFPIVMPIGVGTVLLKYMPEGHVEIRCEAEQLKNLQYPDYKLSGVCSKLFEER